MANEWLLAKPKIANSSTDTRIAIAIYRAEEAGHTNCAVVSQRTLAAPVAWWWPCMAEWKKDPGPQWRNGCAQMGMGLTRYEMEVFFVIGP